MKKNWSRKSLNWWIENIVVKDIRQGVLECHMQLLVGKLAWLFLQHTFVQHLDPSLWSLHLCQFWTWKVRHDLCLNRISSHCLEYLSMQNKNWLQIHEFWENISLFREPDSNTCIMYHHGLPCLRIGLSCKYQCVISMFTKESWEYINNYRENIVLIWSNIII